MLDSLISFLSAHCILFLLSMIDFICIMIGCYGYSSSKHPDPIVSLDLITSSNFCPQISSSYLRCKRQVASYLNLRQSKCFKILWSNLTVASQYPSGSSMYYFYCWSCNFWLISETCYSLILYTNERRCRYLVLTASSARLSCARNLY